MIEEETLAAIRRRVVGESKRRRSYSKRKSVRALKHPFTAERRYNLVLLSFVEEWTKAVEDDLVANLERLIAIENAFRVDGVLDDLVLIFARLREKTRRIFGRPRIEPAANTAYQQVDTHSDTEIEEVILRTRPQLPAQRLLPDLASFELPNLPVSPTAPITTTPNQDRQRLFVQQNVALVRDMSEAQLGKIEALVLRGAQGGARFETIAEDIGKQLNTTENRATLIAQDQVSKLNSNMSRDKMLALGVADFIWRDSRDERVRPLHVELSGGRFGLKEGAPGEGLPGEPIRCRCTMEPVLD